MHYNSLADSDGEGIDRKSSGYSRLSISNPLLSFPFG